VEERTRHLQSFLSGYARLARLPAPQPRSAEWRPLLEQIATLHPRALVAEAPARPAYFDPAQLEQVLLNLIRTAEEARGPGEAAATAEVVVRVDADGASELEVLDDGPGFSAAALDGALLPLYTTKPGGSGMGLALCREIVEGHGGELGVCNRERCGGRVWLSLPAERAPTGATDARSRLTLSSG
jgi:signal transduction histidine kinase